MRIIMYGLALSIVASQTSAFLQPSGSHPGSIVSARSCQFKRDLPLYLSSDDSESKKIATSEKVEDIEQLPSKMGSSSTKPLEVNDEKTAKSSAIEDYIASLNLFNYITVVNDEVKPTPEKKAPKADIKPAVKLSDEKISDEVAKKDEIPETTNEVKVEEMKTDSTEAKDKVDIKEVTSLTEESKKEVEKSKEDQKKTEVLPKVAADSEKILESPKVGTEKTKITAKDEKILEIENVAKTETKTEIEVTVKSPEAFKDKEPTPKVEPIKVTKEEKVEIEEIKEKKSETEVIVEGKGSAEVDKNLSNFTQKLTSFFKNKGPSAVRDPNNDPSARVTDFTDYSGKSLNPLDKDEVDELVEQRGGVLNEVFFKEQFRKLEDNARKGVEKTDKEVTAESDKKGSLPFNFLSGIVPSKDEKKVISDEAEKIEKPKATKSPDSVVEKKSEPINFNIFSNMFNPPIFDDERAETSVPPAIEKKVVSTISKEESEPKQFTNPLAAILRKPTSDNDTEKISRKEEEKKLEPSMIANPFSGMFRKSSDVKKEEKVAQKIEKVEPEPIKNTQSEPLKVKNLFSKILSKSPAAEEKKEKTGAATVPITAIKPPSVERPIQARPPQPTKEPIKIGNPFSGMFAKPIFNEEKPKVIKNDVVVDAPPLKPLSKGKNEEKGNFITNIFSKAEKTEPKVVTPPPQAIKAVIPQKKDAPKQKVSENETMNSIFGMFSKPKAKETVSKTIAAPSAAIKSNKGPFSNVTAPKEAKKVPLKVPQASVKADEKPKPIMKGGSILNSLFKSSPSKAKDAPEIPVAASTQKKITKQVPKSAAPTPKATPTKTSSRIPKKMDDAFIRTVRTLLKGDNNKIKQFQMLTDKFRGSLISSDAYYSNVESLFGENNVENVIQPLLKNLPEQDKRKDLEATIKKAKAPKASPAPQKSFFGSFGGGGSLKKVPTPPTKSVVAKPPIKTDQKSSTVQTKTAKSSSNISANLPPSKSLLFNNRTELFRKGGINAKDYYDSVVNIAGKGNSDQVESLINNVISELPKAKAEQLKVVRDGNRK